MSFTIFYIVISMWRGPGSTLDASLIFLQTHLISVVFCIDRTIVSLYHIYTVYIIDTTKVHRNNKIFYLLKYVFYVTFSTVYINNSSIGITKSFIS